MNMQQLVHNHSTAGIYVLHADSFLKRLLGLIPARSPNHALLLTRCSSIHTFFMPYPIDAYFIDEKGKILKVIRSLAPWKIVLPVPGAAAILEVPSMLSAKTSWNAAVGEVLSFN
jgi:uncharacterized protein